GTQLAADLGAEVIKIEETGTGDAMRSYPPFFTGTKSRDRLSALYVCINEGKKSVALNLHKPEDREKFLELCKTADAVVESFRPGVMQRLGIDYDVVTEVKPDIIYISLTGYGQFGPYRDLPGHDMNYQSLMGNLSLNGKQGAPPIVPNIQAADLGGGLFVLVSLLGALYHRNLTGEGAFIDVAMSDVAFNLARMFITSSIASGQAVSRERDYLLGEYPWYDVYECLDDGESNEQEHYFAVGLIEDKFWSTFCNAPGINLAEHAKNQMEKGPAKDELYAKMRALFKTKTAAEWFALFKEWDIPGTPVQSILEAINDPQVKARDLLRNGTQASVTGIPAFPFPVKCAHSQRSLLEYEGPDPAELSRPAAVYFSKLGELNKVLFPKEE
ncbi:MAG TPA: CaiB/BaiF CoA-transferase family protein, partial [Candidatus Lokiarchaeia archaeon]|nr:CaiB/BaiF CoA-transferase family protein [Candidatus Lokiarchaeia archaeon]